MKKYLLLAILACLTILSGCKKSETKEPETKRILNETYDGIQKMIGAKLSDVAAVLNADGWRYLEEEKGEQRYSKIEGDRIKTFQICCYDNDTSTSVKRVYCLVAFKGEGDDCMTTDDFKALVQHIGQKPTINNEQLGFEELCYGEEEEENEYSEEDYQKAIDLVNEACNHEYVECYWKGEINSIAIGRGMDHGHRVVIINAGDLRDPE